MGVEHDLNNVALNLIALQNIAHGVGSYNIKWLPCSRSEAKAAKALSSSLNQRR
jgi:hypothetical protein